MPTPKVIVPPVAEPVTLAQMRQHLRDDPDLPTDAAEDVDLGSKISAAREMLEHRIGRAIGDQVLEIAIDAFPADGVKLPMPPARAIVAVEYVDGDGVLQTLDPLGYWLDDWQSPAWLLPAVGATWPATRQQANSVRVRYRAGYTTCPAPLVEWIKLTVGSMYLNREGEIIAPRASLQAKFEFVERLVDRYRVYD